MQQYLHDLGLPLNQETYDKFHGIKHIIMQGSAARAQVLAAKIAWNLIGIETNYFQPVNLFYNCRFECYRINNILSVSHGMGTISILNLLSNITKLMQFAENTNFEYIRVGTSGGIGIDMGSIIITDIAYTPELNPEYKIVILGKTHRFSTQMNKPLNQRILKAQPSSLPFKIYVGGSIAADDFYRGQARFDGIMKLSYDEATRQTYFKQIRAKNIYNLEMESTALAGFCQQAKIPATMVATTIINRLDGDQIRASTNMLQQFADNAQQVVINYLISTSDLHHS